ncbi:related to 3-oxoacyl-[acyl-carrier-protein] reductase [Ramularia collo-cygni]|uniref:Related to 3-oxoacyl-[acyl-carrier-protein] reductase n=1 Tax=Ramularia collo-cygni TaxID=112498 RepID=A0A2D3UVP7_9PEZI|nr:related to 3-oxoacyl-[acyl-carrier-protein] reductase [Ramularia collo-cygni]CZT21822.1 related to 3-oxoacyl-[acyl-carrier-protein] reductase [Ramularia collo-cygni]
MDPNTVNPSQLFSVEGMVVVITGGGTGIGLMMTKAFANNGAAKVYIVGRRKEKLEEAARDASPYGNVIPIVGDVTSKESLAKVAEQVKRETGFVNLLCCNSGAYPKPIGVNSSDVSLQEFAAKCLEQEPEDWNNGFSTNTTAVAFTAFSFLELLDAGNKQNNCPGRRSQILVTSSVAGFLRNPTTIGVYPLTKAAVTHLVKYLSGALIPYSIRVNALAPGLFPSDLAASLIAKGGETQQDPSTEGAFPKSFQPSTRLGSTADMAGTVLYMASAAGAFLNGCIHLIDGGKLGQLPATY